MQNLELIGTEHIPLITDFLNRYPRQNCDYTVTNILAWGVIYRNHYMLWQDNLVIFNPKYQYICFPLGTNYSVNDLAELVKLFKPEFPEAELILITEEYYAVHPELDELFEISDDRAWADYVYEIDNLVQLSGRRRAKKKNLISEVVRANPD